MPKDLFYCARSLEECPITQIILSSDIGDASPVSYDSTKLAGFYKFSKNYHGLPAAEFKVTEGEGVCIIHTEGIFQNSLKNYPKLLIFFYCKFKLIS